MKFSEVVKETREWLQREGRVSYRALKLEFTLSEEHIDALAEARELPAPVYNWFTEGFGSAA